MSIKALTTLIKISLQIHLFTTSMNTLKSIRTTLIKSVDIVEKNRTRFFKVGPGDYAEHDKFLGLRTPTVRKVLASCKELSWNDIEELISSEYNEERMLSLFILIDKYKIAEENEKLQIVEFYKDHMGQVNNWNLVDCSAYQILGDHLTNNDKTCLVTMANSLNLWERRIAIVSTFAFIRNKEFEWTLKISDILLNDSHDLIHKAVGWMLREVGKEDMKMLKNYLNDKAANMPRTLLRYAIEKMNESERKKYLNKT